MYEDIWKIEGRRNRVGGGGDLGISFCDKQKKEKRAWWDSYQRSYGMREGEAVEKGDQELFFYFCRRWCGSQARGGLILKA